MKNQIKVLGIMVAMILMLTGCNSSMSLTFNIETGDNIQIKLDTSTGYTLKQVDGMFTVCDEEENDVLQGFFVTEEMYNLYLEAVNSPDTTIIETAQQNGCSYTQYQFVADTHTENNFICWVDGSNTGVVLASIESMEEAEEAFDLLSFSY